MNIFEKASQDTQKAKSPRPAAETSNFTAAKDSSVTDGHYLLCLVVLTALGVWKNGVPAFWTAAVTVISAAALYAVLRGVGGSKGKSFAKRGRAGKTGKISAALPVVNAALATACLFAPVMPLHILIFAGFAAALTLHVLPLFSPAAAAVAISAALFPANFIRSNTLSYALSDFAGVHADILGGGFTAAVIAAAVYICLHRPRQLPPVIIPAVLIPALPSLIGGNIDITALLDGNSVFAAVFLLYIPAVRAAPCTGAGRVAYGVFAGVCGLLFVHFAKTDYPFVYAALFSNAFACGADSLMKYCGFGITAAAAGLQSGRRRHTYDTVSNTVNLGDDFIPEQDATREIDFLNYNMPEITSKVTKSKRKSNLFLSILSVLKRNGDNKKTTPPKTTDTKDLS